MKGLNIDRSKAWLIIVFISFLLAMVVFKIGPVEATHTEVTSCNANTAEATSTIKATLPANPTGSGYLYQTVEIRLVGDAWQTGHTLFGNCTLNRSNVLEYAGLYADQVWLGPEIPGQWDAGRPPQGCTAQPPTQAGVYKCDDATTSNGKYDFYQDDAGAVTFGASGMIYCNGIVEYCPKDIYGKNGDIYRNGWWPAPNAISGAGYADLPSPTQLGGNGLAADGRLNDIPLQMWARNTWPGGYGMFMTLTFRYPQNPMQIDLCPNIGGIQTSLPAGYVKDGAGNCVPEWGVLGLRVAGDFAPYTNQGNLPAGCGNVYLDGGSPNSDNPYNYTSLIGSHTISAEVNVNCGGINYTLVGYSICDFNTNNSPPGCHSNVISNPSNSVTLSAPEPGTYDLWWHYQAKQPLPQCEPVNPLLADENQTFKLTVAFSNPSGSVDMVGATLEAGITDSGGGNVYGPTNIAYSPNPVPGGSVAKGTTTDITIANAGVYSVKWKISGGNVANDVTCSATLTVVNKPYFRVYNSDILAGFGGACSGWTSGATTSALIAYNDGTGKGSGTQLAAFAVDAIIDFSSATGRSSPPMPPKDLSFANTDASKPFGGDFGSGSCPEDYFAKAGGADNTTNASSINVGALSGGSSRKDPSGNLRLNPGGGATSLSPAERKVLYVEGDVFIANNVEYTGMWNSISDIPNFSLVVKGDIYIDKDVDRLDGVYIAQPRSDGSGGEIHTCGFASAPLSFTKPTSLQLINDCSIKQLTINGAFIAKRVRFQRSIGKLSNSSNSDDRFSGLPAEKFIFGPDAWLSFVDEPKLGGSQYDAITALPPVL